MTSSGLLWHSTAADGILQGGDRKRQENRKRQSQSEMWGSALTDHSVKENHVIDWESAKIVEKEREDLARGIKEAGNYQTWTEMRGDTIYPIYMTTSLGRPHTPRGGGRAKTTEDGTVQSPPCSIPSAAVLCHNSPEEVTWLVMKIWHARTFYCLSLN